MPSIQAYRMAANAQSTVTTQGASIGTNYYLSPNITLNGNYSWNKLNKEGEDIFKIEISGKSSGIDEQIDNLQKILLKYTEKKKS